MIAELAITAWLIATGVMIMLWFLHLKTGNAGLVDIGWSVNFGFIAIAFAVLGEGFGLRRLLLTGMVVLWSFRLTYHLLRRTIGQPEDARYQQLRSQWKTNLGTKFFFFFMFQGVLNVLLALPFLLVTLNQAPDLSIAEVLGFSLWTCGIIGESIADRQLRKFKSLAENRYKVCQVGLWKYSRHPNYFFEWLVWMGYFVYSLGSPWGWLSIISPLLMLYFLLRVTGIPATEKQSLRSKGEAYRRYQRSTSAFFPWFEKKKD